MTKVIDSTFRCNDTAPRQCGLIAINSWWRGNWWRFTPPAVPIASACGVESSK